MKTIDNDLKNPFDDPLITNTRLDPFAKAITVKLTNANGSGQYTTIIADINTPLTPFHASMQNLNTDKGITAGQTETREGVITDFKAFASKYQGTVELMYETDHAKLITFYLHGMADFNAMNKSTALILITGFAEAITLNHTDWDTMYPTFVSIGEAFPARYSDAVDTQDDGKTTTGTDKVDRNDHRPALNVALFDAYNFVKYYTSANPTAVKAIWADMAGLIPSNSHTEKETNKGPVAKMATVNTASGNYDDTYYVLVRNVGTTNIRAGLQTTATEGVPLTGTVGKTINAGKSRSFQIITMGAALSQFLNITNTDLNNAGEWEIEIYTK
jgi:hypothetical protein